MERINQAFADAVCRLLDSHGLSLRGTRLRTGVDIDTISRMRSGDVPRIDKVIDFARGFGEDINYWLELAGYPRIEPTYSPWQRYGMGFGEIVDECVRRGVTPPGKSLFEGGSYTLTDEEVDLELARLRLRYLGEEGEPGG